ncbi:MAG TPA: hypothetical protein DDW31_02595 [candidate division Zixibacteria bacterium]|jgi:hypothetical protein|nr:hypothetical protein [candidate division Zixibacteria bacterium]
MKLTAAAKPILLLLAAALLSPGPAPGQDDFSFQRDSRLLIEVHVWGEVNKPGLYRVPDGSTALDAISLAGGPTQFASISKVKLTRAPGGGPRSEKIDLDRYADGRPDGQLPVLRPGDMITVPRNARFFWKDAVQILADIAIIVNVYYLISRNR